MTDRRTAKDRRSRLDVPEAIERKRPRRAGDRRLSARYQTPLTLRMDGATLDVLGELGIGGASFTTRKPPRGPVVQVRARLAPRDEEFVALAAVVGRAKSGERTRVHLEFPELASRAEHQLARWLDAAQAAQR